MAAEFFKRAKEIACCTVPVSPPPWACWPPALRWPRLKVVNGPGTEPACFKPWDAKTQYIQWPAKKGPYRIALANGFVGNTWRIQMIKTAKAYAEQPGVKANLKEFKVISTGEDLPAQIAAANNFIDAGYDAVIVNALNPAAFAPVAKKAKAAGVVLLSFDNVIESTDNVIVNVDQVDLGRVAAQWLLKEIKTDGGKDTRSAGCFWQLG